jgi:hypothetical protein
MDDWVVGTPKDIYSFECIPKDRKKLVEFLNRYLDPEDGYHITYEILEVIQRVVPDLFDPYYTHFEDLSKGSYIGSLFGKDVYLSRSA